MDGGCIGLARMAAAAVVGVDAVPVEVEVHCNPTAEGTFSPSIVGLPDAAVRESLDRVSTALVNSALTAPFDQRWLINLAPAHLRKEGPSFDLPIALATLASLGTLDPRYLEGWMAVGERPMGSPMPGLARRWPWISRGVRRPRSGAGVITGS